MSDTRATASPLSKARRAGNLLFVSGQLPRRDDGSILEGDIEAQTEQVLANLSAILAEHGCRTADVVKVTGWLTSAVHVDGFNRVYRRFFAEPFPARSLVVSQLVAAADVEVEAIALVP